jgi:periplasmic protein CpxP/Spy
MKKYGMLAIAAIFMFSLAVMAQDPTPPQRPTGEKREFNQGMRQQATPQMRAERLAKQLSLTDDQKAKVQALFEKQDANRAKNQAEVKKTREEMKAQFDANRKAQDEELAKIIGAEKFEKYQAARAERMKSMQNRAPQPNQGPAESK